MWHKGHNMLLINKVKYKQVFSGEYNNTTDAAKAPAWQSQPIILYTYVIYNCSSNKAGT